MKNELEQIRELAKAKLATGAEPPWSWYQYMKLVEAADSILSGMAATTTDCSPQSESPQGRHLRLAETSDEQDNAQRRSVGLPVQLPT